MTEKEFIASLSSIPQKYEDFGTISYQMKLDIFKAFNLSESWCIEVGCYKGYTSSVLGRIFPRVLSLDNNIESLKIAEDINKDAEHVSFVNVDLYDQKDWNDKIKARYKGQFGVALIDAAHGFKECQSDLLNCVDLGCRKIILDDVGVYDDIKEVVKVFKDTHGDRIENIVPIGIDWCHYKVPVLNIPVICFKIQGSNIGSSDYQFTWLLQDPTDLALNNGGNIRDMFSMNIHIDVLINCVDFMSGHTRYEILKENSQLSQRTMWPPSFKKVAHDFTPLPAHRYSENTMKSFTGAYQYPEDEHNYEGLIIYLK